MLCKRKQYDPRHHRTRNNGPARAAYRRTTSQRHPPHKLVDSPGLCLGRAVLDRGFGRGFAMDRGRVMATIEVRLDEADIRAACMAWAVTRILNEGKAVGCDLSVTVCAGKPTGTINAVTVTVETARMTDPPPHYIAPKDGGA